MKFARILFRLAAMYGFIVLLPMYFMIGIVGRDAPPAITHSEFYYGFVGLGLTWQALFLLISSNPIRYRPIMLIAIAEKFTFSIPVILLYLRGELGIKIAGPSLVDPVLAALFCAAYIQTREATILKT
jgi:hypothetical protein